MKPTKEEVGDLILSNVIFPRYVGAEHSLHGEGEHRCPEQCLVERERELSRDWAAMSSSLSQSHLADEFHFSFQEVEVSCSKGKREQGVQIFPATPIIA